VHELSLCQAIAGVVRPYAEGRRVDVVRGQVGALRQVVPDSLSFCWTIVREQPRTCPRAELELELRHRRGALAAVAGSNRRSPSRWSVVLPEV